MNKHYYDISEEINKVGVEIYILLNSIPLIVFVWYGIDSLIKWG